MVEDVVRQGHIELDERSMPHFREMLRQQLLGDYELMRDCISGREDPEIRLEVSDRIRFVRALADEVGLPEIPDRRRSNPRQRRRAATNYVSTLTLLIVAVTVLIHFCAQYIGIGGLAALYAPVVIYARLRHGARAGLLTAAGSALAFLCLEPSVLDHDLRSGVLLVALASIVWVVKRAV